MTVKELLQSACGENRNMTTFAEEISQDIPVSASTLYRLAAGETRKAIPAELLQAIIKHADPNSTVTFDELETAFRSQCRTVSRSRRMSKALLMENLAKAAIFETALDCGAAVSKASPIIADPKTGEMRPVTVYLSINVASLIIVLHNPLFSFIHLLKTASPFSQILL